MPYEHPGKPDKWNALRCASQHSALITPEDFVEKGKMNQSDSLDYIIDLKTLSADEFIKKHC